MRLLNLHLQNFMSHTDSKLELANQGIVLLRAENRDFTAADSNYSGKSTLIEGLVWTLFGQTLRKLRSINDVVNRTVGRNTCGIVSLEDEKGELVSIQRCRKHTKYGNEVRITSKKGVMKGKDAKETQRYINDILQTDFTAFTSALIFPQSDTRSTPFSTMNNAAQKDIFERLMGTSDYDKIGSWIKDKIDRLEDQSGILDHSIDRLVIAVNLKKDELRDDLCSLKELKQKKDNEKTEAVAKVRKYDRKREEASRAFDKLLKKRPQKPAKLREKKEEKAEIAKTLTDRMSILTSRIGESQYQIKLDTKAISEFDLLPDQCPTCKQDINRAHRAMLIGTLKTRKHKVTTELDNLHKVKEKLEKKLEKAQNERDEASNALFVAETLCGKWEEALAAQRDVMMANKEAKDDVEKQLKETMRRVKQAKIGVIHLKNEIEKLEQRAATEKEAANKKRRWIPYYRYWRKAFSDQGIASLLMDSITPYITKRANHYSSILTDGFTSINVNSVTKTASGTLKDKCAVGIDTQNGAEIYEACSGGEKRRIDICLLLALGDLFAQRTVPINILLLDEVFDSLDEVGCVRVLSLLREIEKTRESIFVVTHRSGLAAQFNRVITVVRKGGNSFISQES